MLKIPTKEINKWDIKCVPDEMKTIRTYDNFSIKTFRIFKKIQEYSINKKKTISQNTK